MSDLVSPPDVVSLRPFVPAKDIEASRRFYADLGFTIRPLGPDLAVAELGPFSFFIQKYDVPHFAENYMLQLMVHDLDAWWKRIETLNLAEKYKLDWPPRPPALQPWGLTVAYVADPTGVLWHFAQKPS
jgi:catechol 2,3-dioxygenase-like lactoylglutathione lyase family enzyme